MRLQNGTLTKKSGSWLGHYSRWIVDPETGEKTRVQKCYAIAACDEMTKTEARMQLRKRIEQELGLRSNARRSVSWFIDTRWKPLRDGQWRSGTKETNEYLLKLITERFGSMALEAVDSVELQTWLNHLAKSKSASVVKHVRILLKSIFLEAVEQDFNLKSPARMLRVPLLKPVRKSFLTVEQIKTLLVHAKGRDKIIIKMFVLLGLRPSELFALSWKSFDPKAGTLKIVESVYRGEFRDYTKTTDQDSRKDLQVVYLPQELVTDLVAWRELQKDLFDSDDDFMFSTSSQSFILKENYQQRVLNPLACRAFHDGSCAKLEKKCESAPLVNYQIFRRSFATHMQHLGSPRDIQAAMRHSKPDMAQEHYVQAVPESVKSSVSKLATLLLS